MELEQRLKSANTEIDQFVVKKRKNQKRVGKMPQTGGYDCIKRFNIRTQCITLRYKDTVKENASIYHFLCESSRTSFTEEHELQKKQQDMISELHNQINDL